jgi:membrane-associated phospholipid phosphatase
MIIYSMIPVIVPLLLLGWLIWKRNTSSLLALIFLGIVMLFSEGLFKHIIKQARPVGSCDCSFGMPSSHSATSYGFLVWIYLEVGFPLGGFEKFTAAREWTTAQYRRVIYLVVSTISFVPVPFSRVYFLYHTVGQVIFGIVLGTVLALAWFGFIRGLLVPKNWLDKLVQLRPFRVIRAVNDYRPRPLTAYSGSTVDDMEEVGGWQSSSRSLEP